MYPHVARAAWDHRFGSISSPIIFFGWSVLFNIQVCNALHTWYVINTCKYILYWYILIICYIRISINTCIFWYHSPGCLLVIHAPNRSKTLPRRGSSSLQSWTSTARSWNPRHRWLQNGSSKIGSLWIICWSVLDCPKNWPVKDLKDFRSFFKAAEIS